MPFDSQSSNLPKSIWMISISQSKNLQDWILIFKNMKTYSLNDSYSVSAPLGIRNTVGNTRQLIVTTNIGMFTPFHDNGVRFGNEIILLLVKSAFLFCFVLFWLYRTVKRFSRLQKSRTIERVNRQIYIQDILNHCCYCYLALKRKWQVLIFWKRSL